MTTTQINRQLPALAASLRWYKREIIRSLARRIADTTSPAIRASLVRRLSAVKATRPAALRADYTTSRVIEIQCAPLAALGQVATIIRLSA